jgi:PAS domain S-box-containing protein
MSERPPKIEFPFSKTIKVLIFLSLGLQLIVVSQMYFFRPDLFSDFPQLLIRMFRGFILTFFAGVMLVYPSIYLIRQLNARLPWKENALMRLLIQFPASVLAGLLITPVILLPANLFFGLENNIEVILNNAYYLVLMNLFLMLILEALIYFDENARSRSETERLQQELLNKAELSVAEGERRYKELMDFLPQPIFELDIKGNILLINTSGKEFFGITMPEDPGEKVSALQYIADEDVSRVVENLKQSNQGINTPPNEYHVKRPDGSLCPVLIYGSPIIRNNEVVGRRGIIIDISERKKQELKIIRANEELERVNNSLEQIVDERTRQLTEANTRLLQMQKENLQSQFEVLKQQVNPHFLFNSLNVLSGLIEKDASKAQLFIDEFSQIYRYVLETIEKPVVTLGMELGFVRSYIFLQQIRYGENLTFAVNLPSDLLKRYMPPLSLQVVLENAIKHNIVNENQPLHINIFHEDDCLNVSNNLQPKISMGKTTGLGQKNMVKRYAMISEKVPSFKVVNDQYIVQLPLLDIESDERTDN